MNRLERILFRCAVAVVLASRLGALAGAQERPNVLFISIDDLRNHLGCLGVEYAQTPHLDAFAEGGRIFTHHYVQVPTCGASRYALLRGNYPTEGAHRGNNAILRTRQQWAHRSLPAWFRQHGYRTLSLGKITHYPGGLAGRNWDEGPEELPGAWDRCWIPDSPWETAQAMMHGYANGVPRTRGKSPPWEAYDGPDKAYPDAWVARDAVETLQELAESEEPWFFAVGFFKPHLPFAAPKKYFDVHDPDRIPAPAVTARAKERGGWHGSGEFRGNYGHSGRDPEDDPDYARLMRHAYAAATTYVDAQVGRVLDAFDELALADNTVVVVWSDHGFLLGEHAIWGKHCLYEHALRAPLIFQYPGMTEPGKQSNAVVETVDVFPTLVDLCGLPAREGLDGRSLRPQLTDPDAASPKPALGFWRNHRTVRTERFRYIRYGSGDEQLYDYETDPDESRNLAGEPEFAETMRELREYLR